MRQNRTLYVGRIHVTDDIEEVVARHFAEWGQIDRTRVLTSRGVAFVTYTNEANSQFAKEAMAHQSLDHNEVLNVRWATVDPNPMAQKREARKIEEQAAEAVRRALPAEFVAEIEGRDPDAKRRKRIEGGFGLEGYEAPDEIWYARSRAIEGGGGGSSVAEEKYLITEESATTTTSSSSFGLGSGGGGCGEGILSNATLQALEQKRSIFSTPVAPAAAAPAGGPLVDYGSDDE